MTKVIKEKEIYTNEMEAIQQSRETGEAKYLGLFSDSHGEWMNKKLYQRGRLILNEIYNVSKAIVL